MTNEELSRTASEGVRKRLDEAVVLHNTVLQLRKDLNAEGVPLPEVGEKAFADLHRAVSAVLAEKQAMGAHAFGLVLNRVDLSEKQFAEALALGGEDELAARIVLRCLQKVLARERYAGRG